MEEAANRDVAPNVLMTRLQHAESFLRNEPAVVQDVVRNLRDRLSQTNSPEVARSIIAAAVSRLSSLPPTQPPVEAASIAWLGAWDTTYGRMVLEMNDDGEIVGNYGSAEHEIFGEVNADDSSVFEGGWVEGGSTGRLRFRLTSAGTWQGHWASGDAEPGVDVNWTATRVVDPPALARWAGPWQTSYGGMTLSLSDGGRTIQGWYGTPTNRVVGWTDPARPDVLVGYWYYENTSSSGRIEFRLTGDNAWTGGWSSGMAKPNSGWSGTRTGAATDEGDVTEEVMDDAMEEIGPSEGAEAGSVPAGEYGVLLGAE